MGTSEISADELAFHEESGAIESDSKGRRVLVGLTFDETRWFLRQSHLLLGRHRSDRVRYLDLHQKHERAMRRAQS